MTFDLKEEKRLMLESIRKGDGPDEELYDPNEEILDALRALRVKEWHEGEAEKAAEEAEKAAGDEAIQIIDDRNQEILDDYYKDLAAGIRADVERERFNRSFDIDAAMASRDQTFTPEPIQRSNTEAFQRMGRFGARRERNAIGSYYDQLNKYAARNKAAAENGYQDAHAKLSAKLADRSSGEANRGLTKPKSMQEYAQDVGFPLLDELSAKDTEKTWLNPRDRSVWDTIAGNLLNDDGGATESPSTEQLMEENDESAKYAQQNYGQPAEARLDQPDARDSSS